MSPKARQHEVCCQAFEVTLPRSRQDEACGHVGIVIDPAQHTFVSALRSGVQTSCYLSRYWEHAGRPRFFHFALSNKKASEDEMAMALTDVAVLNAGVGAGS